MRAKNAVHVGAAYFFFISLVKARNIATVTSGGDDSLSVGANDTVLTLGEGVERPLTARGGELDVGLGSV